MLCHRPASERRRRVSDEQRSMQEQEWLRQDPAQEQEWLRQLSLIYVGLIIIGVYLVQPFLTARSLDVSATICVVAFSLTIPLLAFLVILNRQEGYGRRGARSRLVAVAQAAALGAATVGVVAGFWHILWIAGVGIVAGGLVGRAVLSAGYVGPVQDWRLNRDQQP